MTSNEILGEMYEDQGPFVEYFVRGHIDKQQAADMANDCGRWEHRHSREYRISDVKWVWYFEVDPEHPDSATTEKYNEWSPHKVDGSEPVTVIRP